MLHHGLPTTCAVIALGIALLCPVGAVAGSAKSISPFLSPSLKRTLHGDERSLDLSAGGHSLGSADAFFGIDSLSTADRQYLTSGLQWRAGDSGDQPLLRLSALRTDSRGDVMSNGQTLLRAKNRLALGERWYLPELSTEIVQVRSTGDTSLSLGGRALRVGLSEGIGPADYSVGYFQADPQFNALGSAIVAGDRGVEVDSRYAVGPAWQLSHDLRLHQATALRDTPAVVQEWVFSRTPRLTDIGRPWRVSARLGDPGAASDKGTPLALELAAQTARWRSWRLDTSLGWYAPSISTTPLGLPVAGTLWQVSASRGLDIAGLATRIAPTFALGGTRDNESGFGSRTGLKLGFSRLSDNIDLSIDYLSAGWSQNPGPANDVQMTLNYKQSTGAILPGLRSLIRTLRPPWERRY